MITSTVVDIIILITMLATAFCALAMLFAKQPISSALGLLGVLLGTAAIYGLMGEHFIATIQLIVYAGAIMVLFIFSIMLLNLNDHEAELNWSKVLPWLTLFGGGGVVVLLSLPLMQLMQSNPALKGEFTRERVHELGGNSEVLAHALFTQHYISFEAISLALLVALVGAVVLAKRKIS